MTGAEQLAQFMSIGIGVGMLLRLVVDAVASVWGLLDLVSKSI